MSLQRLVLVRHAQTAAPSGTFLGRSHQPLDSAGEQQARELAAWLPVGGLQVRSLWSSPLLRARQTAELLAPALGLPVRWEEDLREIDFGRWEGLTFEEVHQRDPDLVAAWLADEASFSFPDGDSIADFRARSAGVAGRLSRSEAPLVITHSGMISALLCCWLRLPASARLAFRPRHAALTIVGWHGDSGVLEGFNLTPSGLDAQWKTPPS